MVCDGLWGDVEAVVVGEAAGFVAEDGAWSAVDVGALEAVVG